MPMFRGERARVWALDKLGRLWFADVGRWDTVVLPRLVSLTTASLPGHE